MLTRCPVCSTTFRVTPEQLKARSGRVRCGECRHVFNALETLAEESAAAPAEQPVVAPADEVAVAPPPEETIAAEPTTTEPVAEAAAEPARNEEVPPVAEEAAAPTEAAAGEESLPEPEPEAESEMREEPPAAEPAIGAPVQDAEAHEEPAPPEADEEAREPHAWPWAVGIGVALFVLMVQALLHFRTEVAVLYPDARPMLEAICDTFDCRLWRPRKPELVAIESSDLTVADSHLALSATIRNRAPFAQEYPHLELTLTDTADKALVRRVLAPGEYLPPDTRLADGFGARAEIPINLAISAPGIPAVGYRLYLFYP